MFGLAGQVILLVILDTTAGLDTAGWVAGLGYGLVVFGALTLGMHRAGLTAFGPADRVTLTRATLVGGVAALTIDSVLRPVPTFLLVGLTIVALVLDAVDGQVARRTGTVSGLGARFDMEVDAFLILALSVYAAGSMGLWVLLIGAMRYIYVAAGWFRPWLQQPLPPRYWRKVVAAVQGIVLVVASAGVVPAPLMAAALVAALVLLVESFGRDVLWQWNRRASTVGR